MRRILRFLKSRLQKLLQHCKNILGGVKRTVAKVTKPVRQGWAKLREKYPILRFLDGFGFLFTLYLAALTVVGAGTIMSMAVAGYISIATMGIMLLLWPAYLLVALVTSPVILMKITAGCAGAVITVNLLTEYLARAERKAMQKMAVDAIDRTQEISYDEYTGEVFECPF